jgi:plasmid stabilization system protein ParE
MGYQVIFAPQAIKRLAEIVRFIALDNPSAAEKFGLYLVHQAELPAEFPELGRPYRKRINVRLLLRKPYFTYYHPQHGQRVVQIMDYWHSARREREF